MYILKAWLTKKDYDAGEAQEIDKGISCQILEEHAMAKIQRGEYYAAEVYDEKTGETMYHSEEC